ncbi:MAG TPA: NYN domain-containing protein [Gemmatimonadaceae bacterium]|nr:NYN domain-containing protein [Gemmatimonadaceae bacterium]
MNSRQTRLPTRAQSALIHRGPQALSAAPHVSAPIHAPNAALLIDFDNVTMGIRSDLGKELRSLLSSEIIKGKVAVQRAYADWRRYPQYIVPLSEASIDLIFAPAYGSSKKNATDIRLAIDALELVFTRPEIGTFILLSGDSDFSSLVIKLKEYGKYVIGVGIRESSSDLLVQNCDEYYSYNALAGLVKASEEEPSRKFDPWELVTEAVQRMKRNNDVMRSDRLKQVMQEIDSTFDEKNLGISKFSRFCQEAAQRGLLSVTKLDNGQLEVDLPGTGGRTETRASHAEGAPSRVTDAEAAPAPEERVRRSRRGRGRGREREDREPRETPAAPVAAEAEAAVADVPAPRPEPTPAPSPQARGAAEPIPVPPARGAAEPIPAPQARGAAEPAAGAAGERLTRTEAFDLVRRAVADLAVGDESVQASEVRARARQLLGRDSESLSDRMFVRILKDAHDEGIIDLRRRGDDFEVARAAEAAPVSEQLERRERAATAPAAAKTPAPRIGMGPRGAGLRGRLAPPPPELLSIGVVEDVPAARVSSAAPAPSNGVEPEAPAKRTRRGSRGRKRQPPAEQPSTPPVEAGSNGAATRAKRGAKKGGRPRKKAAATSDE